MDPVKEKLESEEEQEFLEITTVLKKDLEKEVGIYGEASVVCNAWRMRVGDEVRELLFFFFFRCTTQLRHSGSLVVACKLLVVACGI